MSHLVSFPTSESTPVVPLPVSHLPFRRISLPSPPNLSAIAHRQSLLSVSSDAEEASVLAHQYRRVKRRSLNPGARPRRRTPEDDARDAKRDKVVSEFHDTERSYLDGLNLVYNHFLTPILASLDTSDPLLTRKEITTLFSNFIDIWNFHHTFFNAFTTHHRRQTSSSSLTSQSVPLSTLLLAHFPYLSLYRPFITAFPASIQLLSSLSQNNSPNPSFKAFIRSQESHSICAHLRLSDYLLTPVQRCPRYLLLLKDLLAATDPADPEWDKLQEVQSLVEKITSSLNTSLAAHAQTLALLSLQRNTRDLPLCVTPLVAPGRQLIKRGTLIREGAIGEGWGRKRSEFILLSDYLLWLEREESGILPSHPHDASPRPRHSKLTDSDEYEKWVCRGFISLLDMEVVMALNRSGNGDTPEGRLEILSPEGSFALYAVTLLNSQDPDSLTSWVTALRLARAARLAAVALSHPDSTLSTSSSNIHVRRALRAFASKSDDVKNPEGGKFKDRDPSAENKSVVWVSRSRPQRAQLDNFLPPVWVPDAKTDACMRCGRPFGFVLDLGLADVFGWSSNKPGASTGVQRNRGAWRRKHHCRLCGGVVCAACSDRTFYILDAYEASQPHNKSRAKAARACNECYEEAFPIIIDSSPIKRLSVQPLQSAYPTTFDGSSPQEVRAQTPATHTSILLTPFEDPETVRGIQPWLSIPNLQGKSTDVGEALMAMDGPSASSKKPSSAGLVRIPSRPGLSGSRSRREDVPGADVNSPLPSSADTPRKWRSNSNFNKPTGLPRDICTHDLRPSPSPSPSPSKRIIPLPRIAFGDGIPDSTGAELVVHMRAMDVQDGDGSSPVPVGPIRIRPSTTRPRSYHDILEDFSLHECGVSVPSSVSSGGALGPVKEREGDVENDSGGDGVVADHDIEYRERGGDGGLAQVLEGDKSGDESSKVDDWTREDTARRRKRFSLPAVALQTAPVFARARSKDAHRRRSHAGGESSGLGRQSGLVHGGRDSSAVGMLMDALKGKPRTGT